MENNQAILLGKFSLNLFEEDAYVLSACLPTGHRTVETTAVGMLKTSIETIRKTGKYLMSHTKTGLMAVHRQGLVPQTDV